MVDALSGFFRFYGSLSMQICCMWFAAWGVRKKYELDEAMDLLSRTIRWSGVIVGLMVGYFPRGAELKWVRICGGLIGLAFLCWPNFAVSLSHAFRNDAENVPIRFD
jgi:hypothetical protein